MTTKSKRKVAEHRGIPDFDPENEELVNLEDLDFVFIWERSDSAEEATHRMNNWAHSSLTVAEVVSWANWYRKKGVPLHQRFGGRNG